MKKPKYKRVLLKLSGEALAGEGRYGIDLKAIKKIAQEIKEVNDLGVEVAIVIGGGNFFRATAVSARGMERTSADYIGMLATLINGLALRDVLENYGLRCRLQSALEAGKLAEPCMGERAVNHLKKGRVVIFAGGTGNPYFTTDTAASLRAMEIKAEVILKATKVDGVYDSDPMKNKGARRFDRLSYLDVLSKNLKVMDATAISLCRDNNLPIIVFNLKARGSVKQAVMGKKIGTIVEHKK